MAAPLEERQWQQSVRAAGQYGLYWALVKLLIAKGVITIEELQAAVKVEADERAGDVRPF